MASSATYNIQLDSSEKFVWNVSFKNDDDSELDVSEYEFRFEMKNSTGAVVWNETITDRPNNYTVQFEKSQPVISALPSGVYTYSFYVTNSSVTDDIWVSGKVVK